MAITSKAEDILELYLAMTKSKNFPKPIYVNPNSWEFKDAEPCRFIVDNKLKKVYVWSALGGIHSDVWDLVGDTRHYSDTSFLSGEYSRVLDSDLLSRMSDRYVRSVLNQDWTWAKRYLPFIDKFLVAMRQRYYKESLGGFSSR